MTRRLGLTFLNLITIIIFLTLPFFVFAGNLSETNPLSIMKNIGADNGPYQATTDTHTVFVVVSAIINLVFGLLSLVFLGLTIYSGIRWMTAGGGEEEINKAKDTIKQAIIGLVIVISSWGIWELIVRLWLSNL